MLWNANGEAVWCSDSYPAAKQDQTIMERYGIFLNGSLESYYDIILTMFRNQSNTPVISADKGYRHSKIITPKMQKKLAPHEEHVNNVLKGLGLAMNERNFGQLKSKFKILQGARCDMDKFNNIGMPQNSQFEQKRY